MLSEKKKRSDLGLHIFLRNSWCPLKKKGLYFHLLSVFPIFVPKSGFSLKKKGLHSESFSEQTSAAHSKLYVLFSREAPKKGGLRQLPYSLHSISTTVPTFLKFFWVFSKSHRKRFFFGETNPDSPFQRQNRIKKKPREKRSL